MMASDENVKKTSCIYDPNFAVVCSFFDKFSTICGIQQPSSTDLQRMIEDTEENAPQLIDLHVRLLRKAKKNVSPDRWERTLARFCWICQPEDCYILEQKGYRFLDYAQRLRILVTLIGAQFDHNTKFKNDLNKLDVKDLRLEPIGRDKDGFDYWAQLDQDANLKIYKEDCDEEKWDLIATDREGLEKLIEELMQVKDPNRKLEEIEDDEPSEADEEEDMLEEANGALQDDKMEDDWVSNEEDSDDGTGDENEGNIPMKDDETDPTFQLSQGSSRNTTRTPSRGKKQNSSAIRKSTQQQHSKSPPSKPIEPKKSRAQIISRPRSTNVSTPVKPLDKEEFAQHLQKLDSQNMLLPLLNLNPDNNEESIPTAIINTESLKSKINQKFNIIKPVIPTAKPGLKLEQILKSKLAQKLTSNLPSGAEANTNGNQTTGSKPEQTESAISGNNPDNNLNVTSDISDQLGCDKDSSQVPIPNAMSDCVESNSGVGMAKRKHSDTSEGINKKCKIEGLTDPGNEIEEPMMLVTGVGSGLDCNSGNYDSDSDEDSEIEEPVVFICGVGSGHDCKTGINENDENSSKTAPNTSSQLSHKVDDILRTSENEQQTAEPPSTSTTETSSDNIEKKKPKLWTIDAICSSDSSSKETKQRDRESVSLFPNYNFNKESKLENPKPYCGTTESYSIFSLTEKKDDRETHTMIPTNFYFGCNNQNPCFLPTETSSANFKTSKSHNVEDLVEDNSKSVDDIKSTGGGGDFNADDLYSKTNNSSDMTNSCSRKTDLEENSLSEKTVKEEVPLNDSCEKPIEETEILHAKSLEITNDHTPVVVEDVVPEAVATGTDNSKPSPEAIPQCDISETVEEVSSNFQPDSSVSNSEVTKVCEELKPEDNRIEQSAIENDHTNQDTSLADGDSNVEHCSNLENEIREPAEVDDPTSEDKVASPKSPHSGYASSNGCEDPVCFTDEEDDKVGDVQEKLPAKENSEEENLEKADLFPQLSSGDEKKDEISKLPDNEQKVSEHVPEETYQVGSLHTPNSVPMDESSPSKVPQPDKIHLPNPVHELETVKEEKSPKEATLPEQANIQTQENDEAENLDSVDGELMDLSENKPVEKEIEPIIEKTDPAESVRESATVDGEIEVAKEDVAAPKETLQKAGPRKVNEENEYEVKSETQKEKIDESKNEVVENVIVTPRRGRPRKNDKAIPNEKKTPKRGKSKEDLNKKAAKTPKKDEQKTEVDQSDVEAEGEDLDSVSTQKGKKTETKRGRKPKNKQPEPSVENENDSSNDENEAETSRKETPGQNDESSDEEEVPVKKTNQRGRQKKTKRPYIKKAGKNQKMEDKSNEDGADGSNKSRAENQVSDETNNVEVPEGKTPKTTKKKRGWLNEIDVSNIEPPSSAGATPGIRQSRRIAQLKIKEQAESKYVEHVTTPKAKKSATTPASQKCKSVSTSKKTKVVAKKSASKFKPPPEESEEETYTQKTTGKKKKKKNDQPKKNFDPRKAWKQSSESSSEEEEEEDHYEEEDEEQAVNDVSDHEFSPESDVEDEDYRPLKRARTAHSKPQAEDQVQDDLSCQRCKKIDQPEWILLCDACDEGWHAACLKPPVMAIPEGDWFCPPCQHNKLITNLQKFMKAHDRAAKKRTNEELRKKRLEFVGISFSNIIKDEATTASAKHVNKAKSENSAGSSEYTDESSEEEEDEPLYQLRVRRQANVRHRLNEYEELMNSAIQRETEDDVYPEEETPQEVAKDEAKADNLEEVPNNEAKPEVNEDEGNAGNKHKEEGEDEEDDEEEEEGAEEEEEEEEVKPVVLQMKNVRKKAPRLTSLDVDSEDDHFSDEDFKGSSAEEQDDDDFEKSESDSEDSYEKRAVRRSTRARVQRYDRDFIDDNSDEDDDEDYGSSKKKKRKRVTYSESDSDEDDSTWGRKKKGKSNIPSRSSLNKSSTKKRKRIRFDGDSDEDKGKKKNSRIKYGLDEDEDDDYPPQRRTRGKKINYVVDNLGSDSEQETSPRNNKSRKIVSDDEEYVEDEPNADKEESPDSENDDEGKSSDDESETEQSPAVRKPSIIESDESDSAPADSAVKDVPAAEPENKPAEASSIKPEISNELNTVGVKAESKDSLILGAPIEDPPAVLQKVDSNPSLQGMQTMAQNLSQNANLSQYPPQVGPAHEAMYTARVPQQPNIVHARFAQIGTYEDTAVPVVSPEDKYPAPMRGVISSTKMYIPPGGRAPPIPYQQPQQVQPPPTLNAPNNANLIGTTPMPPAVSIPRGPPMSIPQGVMPPGLPPPHIGQPADLNMMPEGPMSDVSPISSSPSPKRRPRGRGKKQLEMERLQREREAMGGGEEMMPLHGMNLPLPEMNAVRPPMMPFSGSPSGPPLPPSTFYPQAPLPFSQAPLPVLQQSSTSVTVPAGNSTKRVKITPTRMRMPTTPTPKVMRFPSRSLNSGPGIYGVPTSSPGPVSSAPASSNDGKLPPVSAPPGLTAPSVKAEGQILPQVGGPVKSEPANQYYHQPPYVTSQIPRGYNQGPEFAYGRKPPPGVYPQQTQQQPPPPVTLATSTAPVVVVSRTGGFSNAGAPSVLSSSIKAENVSTPPPLAHPYPGPYPAPHILPPGSSPVPPKSEPGGPRAPGSTPPSAAYQQLLHNMKLPPPQSSTSTSPYAPPLYYTSSPYPRPPPTSSQPPPGSFSHTMSTANFQSQPPLSSRAPPQPATYKPLTPSTVPSTEAPTSGEFMIPTAQSNDFQYSETQSEGSINQSSSFEEKGSAPEETSTGEFGGLVSYFSSQREDDLDG